MSLSNRAKAVKIISIVLIVYSILWGLAPYKGINISARFILDLSDWPLDNLDQELSRNVMWLTAISAGLLGAISVFFYGIIAPAVKRGDKSIINSAIVAMFLWYFIDSVGSIVAGVASNAVFNTLYLVLILTPIIGIKTNPK